MDLNLDDLPTQMDDRPMNIWGTIKGRRLPVLMRNPLPRPTEEMILEHQARVAREDPHAETR